MGDRKNVVVALPPFATSTMAASGSSKFVR